MPVQKRATKKSLDEARAAEKLPAKVRYNTKADREQWGLVTTPYRKALDSFGDDKDGLYEYLKDHRLESPDVCLGYYLMRAEFERQLTASDVADRTATPTEPAITKAFLSALLAGRSGIRAGTWTRIAETLDANPLEFFISEGWITTADIGAYQVPHSGLLMELSRLLDRIDSASRPAFVALAKAVAETVLIQQKRSPS